MGFRTMPVTAAGRVPQVTGEALHAPLSFVEDRPRPAGDASSCWARGGELGRRAVLYSSGIAQVEDRRASPGSMLPAAYEAGRQLVLGYDGLFHFTCRGETGLVDANHNVLAPPGWRSFRLCEAAGVGFAAITIRPADHLFGETAGFCSKAGSGERMACRPATMQLRLLTQQLRHVDETPGGSLRYDELIVRTIAEALKLEPCSRERGSRPVEQAKQLLHGRMEERMNLDAIASEVGVSPVYLTQEFTRCEGVPLYRYQLQLRLTRALQLLPLCEDITGLALDLGFSSHSHFTSAFRKAFGTTPSRHRLETGAPSFGGEDRPRRPVEAGAERRAA